MSTSNNTNKGKSVPPVDNLTWWMDTALAENDSDDKALAARKFQECQQHRAEKKAIDGLTQELKEMRQEYQEQGKWVVATINNLQHRLDPEYVAGSEEELDLEVPKKKMAEASVELGELRKEAEAAVEEPEDEESDDDEV
ncbi:hypothetical protein HYDPIDRAFT_31448 [Hydnomerulius pinastri MD-312]|uniref:Uncharacterized protein n=1 Tax=Hydnomerulius pinastri MD-312 TaxID=994086 RepID=A0A0C9VTN1_9AGAM|nr:hypothetical protein HYDPIDRAFT_31448 [Hydnomerulius pinastri MD-312]